MHHSWIGGNAAERGLGDTRLPAPLMPGVFGWRDEDFHLRSVGYCEWFFQNDYIPFHVSFIAHRRVSSVDAGVGRSLPRHAFAELAGARVLTIVLRYDAVLASRSLLFQPVFVMQAPKDRMADDVHMLRKPVPMPLP